MEYGMKYFENRMRAAKVAIAYKGEQENQDIETVSKLSDLVPLSSAWKSKAIAKKQEAVVDKQLKNYEDGYLDAVFWSLIETFKELPLEEFTLLDAACASGYYSKILQSEFNGKFKYTGSDYSESMVELARLKFPEHTFLEEDLTSLSFETSKFESVLVSGVLEHIPSFEMAISESCRVASKYVILHRCLVSESEENIYSTGFLYNIRTPRIYYAQQVLEEEFKKHGYTLVKRVKSRAYLGLTNQIKLLIKKYILKRRGGMEFTYTFQKTI
jgi:ubiquinone/menaquinone biosynthesis C-methylase UbiE